MPFGAGTAGAEGPKSISHRHLQPKVSPLRTEIDHHLERHIEYNTGMKKGKISDCNGDTWHHEAQDSNGLTIWQAWRVTFNGHQRNLSWHCSEEDAKAFISAGIAQANASHDAQVEAMRNDYEQAEADMAELRGPRGWV